MMISLCQAVSIEYQNVTNGQPVSRIRRASVFLCCRELKTLNGDTWRIQIRKNIRLLHYYSLDVSTISFRGADSEYFQVWKCNRSPVFETIDKIIRPLVIIIIIIIIINDSIYPAVSKASRTGNKVSCQPNDCPNRWVFKHRLKMASDGAETMSAGRSLQLWKRYSVSLTQFPMTYSTQAVAESQSLQPAKPSRLVWSITANWRSNSYLRCSTQGPGPLAAASDLSDGAAEESQHNHTNWSGEGTVFLAHCCFSGNCRAIPIWHLHHSMLSSSLQCIRWKDNEQV